MRGSSLLVSVLVGGAGSGREVLFARVATRAPSHTTSRSSTEAACPGGASDSVHRQRHGRPSAGLRRSLRRLTNSGHSTRKWRHSS